MKYKQFMIVLSVLILSFVYAESNVQDQINDFFSLEGVNLTIGNTTVNNVQEIDDK